MAGAVSPSPEGAGARLLAVLARWAEVGPAGELLRRAPGDVAEALPADRVILSAVEHGELRALSAWTRDGDGDALAATLAAAPVVLEYPSAEGDALRRRVAQLQARGPDDALARHAWAAEMGWERYVLAPVVVQGRVGGFLHADRRADGAPVDERTREDLAAAALALALVFERAVLRQRLRRQQREMAQVARWVGDRSSQLSEGVGSLGERSDLATDEAGEPATPAPPGGALRDLLTRREVEVLQLMSRGASNGDIARELVVSEGTVKFHVKNILRKLRASNRAQATSRYLRLTMRERGEG